MTRIRRAVGPSGYVLCGPRRLSPDAPPVGAIDPGYLVRTFHTKLEKLREQEQLTEPIYETH